MAGEFGVWTLGAAYRENICVAIEPRGTLGAHQLEPDVVVRPGYQTAGAGVDAEGRPPARVIVEVEHKNRSPKGLLAVGDTYLQTYVETRAFVGIKLYDQHPDGTFAAVAALWNKTPPPGNAVQFVTATQFGTRPMHGNSITAFGKVRGVGYLPPAAVPAFVPVPAGPWHLAIPAGDLVFAGADELGAPLALPAIGNCLIDLKVLQKHLTMIVWP
jgi:hypothetical protein